MKKWSDIAVSKHIVWVTHTGCDVTAINLLANRYFTVETFNESSPFSEKKERRSNSMETLITNTVLMVYLSSSLRISVSSTLRKLLQKLQINFFERLIEVRYISLLQVQKQFNHFTAIFHGATILKSSDTAGGSENALQYKALNQQQANNVKKVTGCSQTSP